MLSQERNKRKNCADMEEDASVIDDVLEENLQRWKKKKTKTDSSQPLCSSVNYSSESASTDPSGGIAHS